MVSFCVPQETISLHANALHLARKRTGGTALATVNAKTTFVAFRNHADRGRESVRFSTSPPLL
jgi:hypothetical protein